MHYAYKKVQIKNEKSEDSKYYLVSKENEAERNLDLDSEYVFCMNPETKKKKNNLSEYRFQAYMIKKAKMNKSKLPISGKNWVLIDAERNFSGKGAYRKPDLIAYEKESNSYVILELKPKRILKLALSELQSQRIRLANEIIGANTVYNRNVERENIQCFLVWPAAEKSRWNNDFKGIGVIEVEALSEMNRLNAEDYFRKGTLKFIVKSEYKK